MDFHFPLDIKTKLKLHVLKFWKETILLKLKAQNIVFDLRDRVQKKKKH